MASLDELQVMQDPGQTWRARWRLRRALRAQDRVSATLAELFAMDGVLAEARRLVEQGWMQHGWFTYVGPSGEHVAVTACTPRAARRLASHEVTGACLVGAIVHAGGGPSQARSQLVQRTLDVTWHALFRTRDDYIRWCPPALERAGHMIDLVYWNDHTDRRRDDVVGLLDRARDLLGGEVERSRARQQDVGQRVAVATPPGSSSRA
ncbi:hypothetical protein JCM18899A_18160 [Nocardioides sp. AN3]